MTLTTYYDILNVSPRATDDDVRKAYRTLAMRWHPDRNPRNRAHAEEHFHRIHRAYLILRTQERRNVYNRVLLRYLRSPGIRQQTRRAANQVGEPGMLVRMAQTLRPVRKLSYGQ